MIDTRRHHGAAVHAPVGDAEAVEAAVVPTYTSRLGGARLLALLVGEEAECPPMDGGGGAQGGVGERDAEAAGGRWVGGWRGGGKVVWKSAGDQLCGRALGGRGKSR